MARKTMKNKPEKLQLGKPVGLDLFEFLQSFTGDLSIPPPLLVFAGVAMHGLIARFRYQLALVGRRELRRIKKCAGLNDENIC